MKKYNVVAISIVLLWITFALFRTSSLYAGETPKSGKEIPVYSGAMRDTDRESEVKSQMSWDSDPGLRSAVLNVYKTSASAEDVFNFYLLKIGGKEGMMDMDPSQMEPDSISLVMYEIEYYKDEEFKDYPIEHDVMHHGILMKQKLVENRKPHKPGKWIIEARFNWYHMKSNNDLTTFYVIIHDESFDIAEPKMYKTSTEVQFQVTTAKAE